MTGETTSGHLPGWVAPLLDPKRVAQVKSAATAERHGVARVHGEIELTGLGHELLTYWMSVRGDKAMPVSADVKPSGFRELLPYVRYMSWEGPEDLRIRVFGSALTAALGMDLTGMSLADMLLPHERDSDMERMRLLHAHPCGSVVHRTFHGQDGSSHVVELLNLPVAPGEDGKARIIGSVMMCDPPDAWSITYDTKRAMDFVHGAYIDIGYGVPAAA